MLRRAGAVVLATGLVACAPGAVRTEVLRVPSPDGALDAVVVQTDAGATTDFGYLLTLPRRGCPPDATPVLRVVGATRNAAAAGVMVRWTGPRAVTIDYLDARFADPSAVRRQVPTAGGVVDVAVSPGRGDASAPPGGMPPLPDPPASC